MELSPGRDRGRRAEVSPGGRRGRAAAGALARSQRSGRGQVRGWPLRRSQAALYCSAPGRSERAAPAREGARGARLPGFLCPLRSPWARKEGAPPCAPRDAAAPPAGWGVRVPSGSREGAVCARAPGALSRWGRPPPRGLRARGPVDGGELGSQATVRRSGASRPPAMAAGRPGPMEPPSGRRTPLSCGV